MTNLVNSDKLHFLFIPAEVGLRSPRWLVVLALRARATTRLYFNYLHHNFKVFKQKLTIILQIIFKSNF